jgi:O-antigen biosynthesis protein WbqP
MAADTPDLPTDQMLKRKSPITRLGRLLRRTSLDELPQLINVLRGEMSLVGPRPALYNQDALNAAREALGVHEFRPGITGWAQINGRDEISMEKKVELDQEYLVKRSLVFDLKILLKTAWKAVASEGISH